jgi:hypothetical protein
MIISFHQQCKGERESRNLEKTGSFNKFHYLLPSTSLSENVDNVS